MSHAQNDPLAGIPFMGPVTAASEETAHTRCSPKSNGRDVSDEAVPLSMLATASVEPQEASRRAAEQRREDEEKEASRDRPEGNANWLGRLVGGLGAAIVIGLTGIAGIVICTQLVQASAIIASWPVVLGAATSLTLMVCGLFIAVAIARLIWFWVSYRRHRPVVRRLLDGRKNLRSMAATRECHAEVQKQLMMYMTEFRLEDTDQWSALLRYGITENQLFAMRGAASELCGDNDRKDFDSWRDAVDTRFLGPIDDAADRLIRNYAVLTALKTAMCPYPVLDMAVVVYMGMSMLASLCKIYRMSTDPFSMLYLLGLIAGQAFFAGRIEEHSDEMANWLDESMKGTLEHAGQAIPDIVANVFGKVTAKASQGLANGLLLHRIGRQACRMLRPLPIPVPNG